MPTNNFKVILDAEQTVVAVNWFALNQTVRDRHSYFRRQVAAEPDAYPDLYQLPRSRHDQRPRPKRFWTDLENLSLVRAAADHMHYVADKLCFRRTEDAQCAPFFTLNSSVCQTALI